MTKRYETLDALRALAALAVVVWHWQLLFFDPSSANVVLPDRDVQPFSAVLWPLYRKGYIAVDLFFAISGFVFFYLYSVRILDRSVSLFDFSLSRFSRLYPLHLATLLIVLVLQSIYWQSHGIFFVYQANDVRHFVMQLFMAPNWSPRSPFSFNGPIWSVSIEILLYATFFVVARIGLARPWIAAIMVVAGSLLITPAFFLGRGLMSFYLGALCFFVVRDCDKKNLFLLAAAVVCSLAIQYWGHRLTMKEASIILLAFPTMIILLAINEDRLAPITQHIRWLGDISYSSYLLHFPLLLAFVTIGEVIGLRPDPHSHFQLVVFVAVVIALSLACYRLFEKPAQDYIRSLKLVAARAPL